MKNTVAIIQTGLLAALCVIGLFIFLAVQDPKPSPAEALRQTMAEMH